MTPPPRRHRHFPKSSVAICVDPANYPSATAMKMQIDAAGGNGVLVTNYTDLKNRLRSEAATKTFIGQFDALVLMGNDQYAVAPERYIHRESKHNQKIHPNTRSENDGEETNKARAAVETRLLHEALRKRMPVIGICGGMQRINVECGEEIKKGNGHGTLHQYLPDIVGDSRHEQETMGHAHNEATQEVQIAEGSKLSGLFNSVQNEAVNPHIAGIDSAPATTAMVSTRHQQAVHKLADGLKVSAFTTEKHAHDDEKIVTVVKAIEADPHGKYKNQFILGTQFHPELVADHKLGKKLAERAVKEAEKYATKRRTPMPRKAISHGQAVKDEPSNRQNGR